MPIGSISTSHPPQALQTRPPQRVQGLAQLKSNGLPKSPLSPSGTSKAGQTMSKAAPKRLLDLHM